MFNPFSSEANMPFLWVTVIALVANIAGNFASDWLKAKVARKQVGLDLSDKFMFENSLREHQAMRETILEYGNWLSRLKNIVRRWASTPPEREQLLQISQQIGEYIKRLQSLGVFLSSDALEHGNSISSNTLQLLELLDPPEGDIDLNKLAQAVEDASTTAHKSAVEVSTLARRLAEGHSSPLVYRRK